MYNPPQHTWAMVRYYMDQKKNRRFQRENPRIEVLDDLIHRGLRAELATMMYDDDDDDF